MRYLSLVLVLCLGVGYAAAATVEPVLYSNWSPAGGAEAECGAAGSDCPYAYKINRYGVMDGAYETDEGAVITISGDDGYTFDWASTWPVCAVIVKASTYAYVFYYDTPTYSDTGLYSPRNPRTGKPFAISHVTFCYTDPECEWIGETAWADGERYVEPGNWATYTPYVPDSTVTLYAGQTMDAGTVYFSEAVDGWVTITITLNYGWRFADVAENVKIQDYAEAPVGNPSPGQFDHKEYATESPFEIVVPENNFYGVHVDVEWESCP